MDDRLIRAYCRRFCLPNSFDEFDGGFAAQMPIGLVKFSQTNILSETGQVLVWLSSGRRLAIGDLTVAKTKLVCSNLTLYCGPDDVRFESRYEPGRQKDPNPTRRRPYISCWISGRLAGIWALDSPEGVAYRDVLANRACVEQFFDWLVDKEAIAC